MTKNRNNKPDKLKDWIGKRVLLKNGKSIYEINIGSEGIVRGYSADYSGNCKSGQLIVEIVKTDNCSRLHTAYGFFPFPVGYFLNTRNLDILEDNEINIDFGDVFDNSIEKILKNK